MSIMDKLYKKVEERGNTCVGLDTSLDYIPSSIKRKFTNYEDMIFNFNKEIIDSTFDKVACFKLQIAYYEAQGIEGLRAYSKTLKYIKEKDSLAIGDIKRGDIKDTAKMYAKAHFEGDLECDFITLNPYMGMDSIEPYLPYMKKGDKGVFILLRTSNKGAKDIQYIESRNGKRVYDIMGEKISYMGKDYIGEKGYSQIGAVVGCTHIEEGKDLREKLNNTFFLIPGYGAQGGNAKDVAIYLNKGNGGVVNSSRKIILAYKEHKGEDVGFYARQEVMRMNDEIKNALNI
ncbi:orotidine-5'-phosphate decarboxylase [Clostridium algidicarnis]|uniref:orotidine-5'-phosphate decarboxylase n=1 Tax=Clostridium algidicarnis TaxID=37659 RepID=UPI001C0C5F50|nr:orotidine-5'-phosphate decarboxylase [Clostridium algidicarnis]MBU3195598.1 orotidine-5'-phosphate decarboxylase [Clostridium algidicarnis]MBU3208646.1 orotidine-5'-phosphate decarboxylase [Clostridium algidicarnis]MBU3226847.1 orotidine-5'-phosphate decarboxylase [Clostridium algidicarnis]MBU3250242.1 orotidine-5'-phosphate decarboxylase [Clostridium algidicarnis]